MKTALRELSKDDLTTRQASLYEQMGRILDAAASEKRELTAEEDSRYAALDAGYDGVTAEIESRRTVVPDDVRRQYGKVEDAANSGVTVLTRGQNFADVVDAEGRNLSLGKYVKGVVTGAWEDATEERAMAASSLTAGGYLVPVSLSAKVFDKARAISRVMQAGAGIVPMDSSTLRMAKIVGDPALTYHAENVADIPDSEVTLGAIDFSAKTVSTLVTFSRELAEDAGNLDAVVLTAIAGAVAAETDRAALYGAGTATEPRGLINQPGLTKIAVAANGGPLTVPLLYQAVQAVLNGNYEPSAMIHSPRTEVAIAQLASPANKTIDEMPILKGIPRGYTTTVPNTRPQGTNNASSDLFVGDFSNLLIGMRTNLAVEVLRERRANQGQYQALVWLRFDVAVSDVAAFAAITGITG